MKKKFLFFLIAIFLTTFGSTALAKERIVQLTIPGCAAWGAKQRVGAILKDIKGVKKYDFEKNDFVAVTFDDKITSLKIITEELKKGGKEIKEKPVYLK